MGSSENFCLRWNDFESNVSSAFRDLRSESDFFDVTLACDDDSGRTLQAHKVILSACSAFFKKMLRRMASAAPGHPNPLIYLRGVRLVDLESVLDFMYHGEVNVAQDDLNTFLGVAEDLQIKGLTQQSKEMSDRGNRKNRKPNNEVNSGSAAKRPRKEEKNEEEVVNVKSEPSGSGCVPTISQETFEDAGPEEFAEDAAYEEGFAYDEGDPGEPGGPDIESSMDGQDSTKEVELFVSRHRVRSLTDNNKNWMCTLCGHKFSRKSDCGRHIESLHFDSPGYSCPDCAKILKTRDMLRRHQRRCKYQPQRVLIDDFSH